MTPPKPDQETAVSALCSFHRAETGKLNASFGIDIKTTGQTESGESFRVYYDFDRIKPLSDETLKACLGLAEPIIIGLRQLITVDHDRDDATPILTPVPSHTEDSHCHNIPSKFV